MLIVKGGRTHSFRHGPLPCQAGGGAEPAEVLPNGKGAGGQDDGLVLPPERGFELRGQFRHRAAQHGPAVVVVCRVEDHLGIPQVKEGYCGGDGGQQAPGFPGQQALQLPADHRQDLMRPLQEHLVGVKSGPFLHRERQFLRQRLHGLGQQFRREDIPFHMQAADQLRKVLGVQRHAEHLPGGFRQLVCLVYDDGRVVRQDGLFLLAAVDEVRQQEVVVADLDRVLPALAGVQKTAVPAVLPSAITPLGDADPLPVVTAHPGQLVQIQHMPGGVQGLAGGGVLMAAPHLPDPPFQTGIADVVGLALADDRLNGCGDQPLGQQHAGQQGQVLLLDGVLQRDAGGGDQDRALRPALCRPALAMQDAGGQVGEGLADAGPRVAQGDAAVQHGVQDAVTQPDLFRPLRHAPLRQ